MKAIVFEQHGGRDQLRLADVPDPALAPGEVLIAVRAASVGLWDVAIREGFLPVDGPYGRLGWEAAGVVVALGAGVDRFAVGDEVMVHHRVAGAYAELFAAPADAVALKPAALDFATATALPIGALTAHQVIVEDLAVRRGETVLITAGSGGTGMFAVQLAATRGARVIATTGPANAELVRSLGAETVLDYRGDVLAGIRDAAPDGVDALLDGVGPDSFAASLAVVRDGGRAAGIVWPPAPEPERGISVTAVVGRPDGARLAELARRVDAGKLRAKLHATFPLAEAARAHELVEGRHLHGKVALEP